MGRKRLTGQGNSLWVQPQQKSMDPFHSRSIHPQRHYPQLARCRSKWPISLSCNDSVCNREDRALHMVVQCPIHSVIMQDPLQVEAHTPDRIISVPGALVVVIRTHDLCEGHANSDGIGQYTPGHGTLGTISGIQEVLNQALQARLASITVAATL